MSNENVNQSKWIRIVGRIGFFAKGVIYFSIGILAFQIAIGMGGKTSGSTQILKKFIDQPFGTVLLSVIFVGLLAHAAWKIINGIWNVEQLGSGASGIFFRGIEVVVGLLYISLSYAAWQILTGTGAESGNQSTQIWISKILTLPHGKAIVIAIAVITAIIGLYQFYYAFSEGYTYRLALNRMSKKRRDLVHGLAKIGLSSWGIVYLMVGFLFYQSAIHASSKQAGGLGEALSALAKKPYGNWVLGITAAGLIMYGLYMFILSYYHSGFEKGRFSS